MKKIIFILFFISGLYGRCFSQALHLDGILAVIGEKTILRSDLETEMAQLLSSGNAVDTQEYMCYIMRSLITKKLLLNQAQMDSLPLSDDQLDAEIDKRLRYFEQRAGSEAELERYLGKSIAVYREEIRPKMKDQMLVQEMERKITATAKISPQEVKMFFDTIPQDSIPIIPAEIKLAQLIIEAPISNLAKDFAKSQLDGIRRRILAGENFEKLASIYSEDPGSKGNGGLLPEFGRGDMVPEFERQAFKLKPDSISAVFESNFGYHIMKLISRKGERIIAKHILVRPQHSATDLMIASRRADSIYQQLVSHSVEWCDMVKKYQSNNFGEKGNCGFLTDEQTGSNKIIFDGLPTDEKLIIEKMEPGSFSRPQVSKSQDGKQIYRIFYLMEFIPPHQANLIQDYPRIQIEAEAIKKQRALDTWVEKNRKITYIRIRQGFILCPDLLLWENQ